MNQSTKTTAVPTDIMEGLARGLLTPSQASLVAAVLTLSQSPATYTGSIQKLASLLQVPFKEAYARLKKAEVQGILVTSYLPHDEQLEREERQIAILPAATWLT